MEEKTERKTMLHLLEDEQKYKQVNPLNDMLLLVINRLNMNDVKSLLLSLTSRLM